MVYLDKTSEIPLYEQIYNGLKQNIEEGRLERNYHLKSLRILEKELGVSRNTIDRAYQQLVAEGYIRAVHGQGYFVEDIGSDVFRDIVVPKPVSLPEHSSKKIKVKYDFEYESIESELFPWRKWKKYIHEALLLEESGSSISYESGKGNLKLRESLAGFLHRHRGVVCSPEQIVLCAGTQFAMDILTAVLPKEKHRIAFEEPGYNAMRYFLEENGYSITSIPVHDTGIYTRLLDISNCNVLYITPSHHFPTGAVTSIAVRNQLLKWAYTTDSYIIENDYDSEFLYGMMPIPSFQSLDYTRNNLKNSGSPLQNRVIYMGTLSKVLSPSVRCAYLILPQSLLSRYEEKYRYFNSPLPKYHQIALANMITDGELERHIRKLSIINEKKYDVLTKAIGDYLSDRVKIIGHPAGVHTLVKIPGCKDHKQILDDLERESVRIYSIKEHCHDQIKAYEDLFMMGFNSMSEQSIRNGCRKMAEVLKK
jgi:GntR family transcriptional regulator/MocR family aminotransferase